MFYHLHGTIIGYQLIDRWHWTPATNVVWNGSLFLDSALIHGYIKTDHLNSTSVSLRTVHKQNHGITGWFSSLHSVYINFEFWICYYWNTSSANDNYHINVFHCKYSFFYILLMLTYFLIREDFLIVKWSRVMKEIFKINFWL